MKEKLHLKIIKIIILLIFNKKSSKKEKSLIYSLIILKEIPSWCKISILSMEQHLITYIETLFPTAHKKLLNSEKKD